MKKNNQKFKAPVAAQAKGNQNIQPVVKKKVADSGKIGLTLNWYFFAVMGIIVLVTFLNFRNALDNEFVNLDDDKYVINNQLLTDLSAKQIKFFFTEPFDGNYHPLTMISLAMVFCTFSILHLFLYCFGC